jgi:hypothetical protein
MWVRLLAGETVLLFSVASKSVVAHIWWNVSFGGQAGRHVKLTYPRPSSAEIRNEWNYRASVPCATEHGGSLALRTAHRYNKYTVY